MSDRRTKNERRERRERRSPRERRKNADNRIVVIELAESDLRVAILQRGTEGNADQVDAMIIPWRLEATSPNTEQGLIEFTTALRSLVEKHALAGCQVRYVLGGRYCVTKAILGSTEEVRSELQQLQQRSQLYLLLGTGEKVTVSNSKPLDARHSYAVASVCHAKTLDTLYEASERTGLRIESIEPALVANSRAVGRLLNAPDIPTLLIHLDHSTVEIGVSHRGRLLLEYRPGSCETPEELVEVVRTHFGRLERHVGRLLGEASPKLRHIYLSGAQNEVENALRALSQVSEVETQIVSPAEIQSTWQLAAGIKDPGIIPALGAMLGTYLPAGESDAPNFMDHITAVSREPLKPILLRSVMPIAAVLLVAIGIAAANFHQQRNINGLQAQIDELAVAQARARELQLKQLATQAKLAQLNMLAAQLVMPPTADVLRRIAHCMPSDVWVNSLSYVDDDSLALKGSSFLEAGVFDFVRWLEQTPGFDNVALRGTKSGQSNAGPTVDFDVELNLVDPDAPAKEVARRE
ncbi:MAG: PilN domain-containing protein [Bythopirellula sp.]|nr:PilN domain-containing protein [Bythopirellula sp.]